MWMAQVPRINIQIGHILCKKNRKMFGKCVAFKRIAIGMRC